MKIFISQPMSGKTYDEIIADRNKALELIAPYHSSCEVINSVKKNPSDNAVKELGWSITRLADADWVFFAPGWKDARGCQIEHDIALKYNMKIIEWV